MEVDWSVFEADCADEVLAVVEGHDELQESIVADLVLALQGQASHVVAFVVVHLQRLLEEGLDPRRFEHQLFGGVELHDRYLHLRVDQPREPLSRPVIDRKIVARARFRLGFWDSIAVIVDGTQAAEVFLEEDEVILVRDVPVSIQVYLSEERLIDLIGAEDLDGVERVLHSIDELLQVHNPPAALRVHLLPVQPLDGHFSEVLLDAEIDLHNL